MESKETPLEILQGIAHGEPLTLEWPIKRAFQYYVGRLPDGAAEVGDNVEVKEDGIFSFPVVKTEYSDDGLDAIHFGGIVHFVGHNGALALTFREPRIEIDTASQKLLLTVNTTLEETEERMDIAELKIDPDMQEPNIKRFTAALTLDGSHAFLGVYSPYEALDDLHVRLSLKNVIR